MKDSSFVNKINENTARFRKQMTEAGFTISGEDHAICPVMIGDAGLASQMADDMLGNFIEFSETLLSSFEFAEKQRFYWETEPLLRNWDFNEKLRF